MKTSFFSLASGSSGNCYYLGTDDYGILIDTGISIRTIKKVLKDRQIDLSKILAILITHDHADHIKTVGVLGEKYNIPVYSTEIIHDGIDRSRYIEEPLSRSRRLIQKENPFTIRDFEITAFDVPHDSSENIGYQITFNGLSFVLATDIGHITSKIDEYASKANFLVIEANYDKEMLMSGSYPEFLKIRVASPTGHLSNQEIAEYLAKIYTPQLKHIWLCHLSRENNHPELAYKTVDLRLSQEGIKVGKDVQLNILKRNTPSDIFILDK